MHPVLAERRRTQANNERLSAGIWQQHPPTLGFVKAKSIVLGKTSTQL